MFKVKIDFGDFDELRGDKDAIEATSIGLVVLHEIEHNLHGPITDARPDPGEVESRYINPIRGELGLPKRLFYAHNQFVELGERHDYLVYRHENQTTKIVSWRHSQVTRLRKP